MPWLSLFQLFCEGSGYDSWKRKRESVSSVCNLNKITVKDITKTWLSCDEILVWLLNGLKSLEVSP